MVPQLEILLMRLRLDSLNYGLGLLSVNQFLQRLGDPSFNSELI